MYRICAQKNHTNWYDKLFNSDNVTVLTYDRWKDIVISLCVIFLHKFMYIILLFLKLGNYNFKLM